jgi:hypothetical protein
MRLAIEASKLLAPRSMDIRCLDQQAIFLQADIAHRVSGRRSGNIPKAASIGFASAFQMTCESSSANLKRSEVYRRANPVKPSVGMLKR